MYSRRFFSALVASEFFVTIFGGRARGQSSLGVPIQYRQAKREGAVWLEIVANNTVSFVFNPNARPAGGQEVTIIRDAVEIKAVTVEAPIFAVMAATDRQGNGCAVMLGKPAPGSGHYYDSVLLLSSAGNGSVVRCLRHASTTPDWFVSRLWFGDPDTLFLTVGWTMPSGHIVEGEISSSFTNLISTDGVALLHQVVELKESGKGRPVK